MAFPVVSSSALSSRGSGLFDDPITMPAGIVAGDLLIVIHSTDVGGGTRTWSGSFIELLDLDPISNLGIAYKFAAGGDTLTVTKSVSERFSAIALRITGMHATQAPELVGAATGTSTGPNAASLTASWGAADNLWITFHGHDTLVTDTTITTFPANYIANQLQGTYFSSSGEPNLATRNLAAATEDAGAWLVSQSVGWRAGTIVVRPAAAAAPGQPFLSRFGAVQFVPHFSHSVS